MSDVNEHSAGTDGYADVREHLRRESWAVYRVKDGRFFGDTAFGPMWKNFPDGMETGDLHLDSYREVKAFLGEPFGEQVSDDSLLTKPQGRV
jgi:hypothetical protein